MPDHKAHPLRKKAEAIQIFQHDFEGKSPSPEPLRVINEPPPWRSFGHKTNVEGEYNIREMSLEQARRGEMYEIGEDEALIINAALALRRPLLVSGHAGVGKTSLAYAIAWQLGLGNVIKWPITSRSVLKEALYQYDAIGRLQDASLVKSGVDGLEPGNIGDYITLGPLGTALLPNKSGPYHPHVLLIDEIDKCDIDLPNDLLHVLEEGTFSIPEISRNKRSLKNDSVLVKTWGSESRVKIPSSGFVKCDDFPVIIMTTNGERDFSPAFKRRCLELSMLRPDRDKLERIIRTQFSLDVDSDEKVNQLLDIFEERRSKEIYGLAIDQLLNAIFLVKSKPSLNPLEKRRLLNKVFQSLTENPNLQEE